MRKGFIHTENYRRLQEALASVYKRGAPEVGLVVVKSTYGIGKSRLLERLASDNDVLFVRCKDTWTRRAMLDELAIKLGLDTTGRNAEVQGRIIGHLGRTGGSMMFDEADFLVRGKSSLLECIRDITDTTEVACFLVAMSGFLTQLNKFPHIASRVNRIVELQPLSVADVAAACQKLCEVPLHDAVVAQVHAQTQGRMRFVLGAIANLEQWAAANGWAQVLPEHIKGRALCVEFKSAGTSARKAGV